MPPSLPIPIIIDRLRNHPTFKAENEILATVAESYVVAFEFRRPEGGDVLRHEQEFGDSAKQGEMEMKRKNWIRVSTDSDRTSPLILSMLDFEK